MRRKQTERKSGTQEDYRPLGAARGRRPDRPYRAAGEGRNGSATLEQAAL